MKKKYYKTPWKTYSLVSETPLEALEELQVFFIIDMWHAHAEWKTQEDMNKYLDAHFKICADQMKAMRYGLKKPKHK